MESEAPRREDPRQGRRGRRHGRMLGAGPDQPLSLPSARDRDLFLLQGRRQDAHAERTIDVVPGSFVVHPKGELHEYINGPQRTMLFRVRYGDDMLTRHMENRHHKDWTQKPEDADFFRANPALVQAEVA